MERYFTIESVNEFKNNGRGGGDIKALHQSW